MNNTITNKQIAIIGGGPGGLTLARLLQMKGARVSVYKRDINKDARVQGATLDLHEESGLEALRNAGLINAFMENYRPGADLLRLMDNDANIVYDQHNEVREEDLGHQHFRPEIDRGPLRKILLESLATGTVVWDSQLLSLEETSDGWAIHFKNGTTATADIVIGADGANSKVRAAVTSLQPVFAGVTVIEGNIYDAEKNTPNICNLLKGGKIFAMGDDKTLIVSAKGDGSIAFYIGFKTDEHWFRDSGIDITDNNQLLKWFKKDYGKWASVWAELFSSAESTFVARPQYYIPLDQPWQAHDNITLLGDAAHLMPPYAGEGVNMAMLDALTLSQCLTDASYTDVRNAIQDYENKMRAYATEAFEATMQNTAIMHSPNGLSTLHALFTGQD